MSKKKEKLTKGPMGKTPEAKSGLHPLGIKMEGISKRGWKVIAAGVGIAALGFFVLSLTDPGGQNWASNLSPFLILGGYATIAVGIILPEKTVPPS